MADKVALRETNLIEVWERRDGVGGTYFVATIYDHNHEFIAEGYAETCAKAVLNAWTEYAKNIDY